MHEFSLTQLSLALKQKKLSSVELTQHCLNQIDKHQSLNAFISVDPESAIQAAQKADKILASGQEQLLTGIPMGLKDLICTKHLKTTSASKMLADYQSPFDATLVTKLYQQGAILVGKNNMDEFAMGSTNDTSYFGPCKNPWDPLRTPGGSSGGSAAAVAAKLVPFSIASDTGGSIRQPAAFCGVSGIKPTYGLISRYGMIAYASSLDQAGPIAHSAQDLALVLEALVGQDPKDSTSVMAPSTGYTKEAIKPLGKLRIGLPSCFFQPEVEPGIQKAVLEAVDVFKELKAEIIPMDLKYQHLWVACYYVIACAEASSNLARYDGLRFGYRSKRDSSLIELIKSSRSEAFGPEVQRRLLIGNQLLSGEHFDAEYLQAQKIRRLIQQELLPYLNQVDAILGPTTPTCAYLLDKKISDPIQRYLGDVFTVAANLAGLPALSIPVGFDKGLPIGMQLMGKHFSEGRLLNLAFHYQQQTNWHKTSPDNL